MSSLIKTTEIYRAIEIEAQKLLAQRRREYMTKYRKEGSKRAKG